MRKRGHHPSRPCREAPRSRQARAPAEILPPAPHPWSPESLPCAPPAGQFLRVCSPFRDGCWCSAPGSGSLVWKGDTRGTQSPCGEHLRGPGPFGSPFLPPPPPHPPAPVAGHTPKHSAFCAPDHPIQWMASGRRDKTPSLLLRLPEFLAVAKNRSGLGLDTYKTGLLGTKWSATLTGPQSPKGQHKTPGLPPGRGYPTGTFFA